MPKGERLSAVAKRRRRDGNLSSAEEVNPSLNHSRPQSPRKISPQKSIPIAVNPVKPISRALELDDNEFSVLVDTDIVQFSNYREIERITAEAIVIRLSNGQKCLISGGYSLWVKAGAIELFGARLEATSIIHHVYLASSYELPSITALSKTAEFEIRSRSDEILQWAGQSMFHWTPVGSADVFYVSFFVHGYSAPISGGPPTVNQFDTSLINEVIHRINHRSDQTSSALTPIVLFCGRQSPGIGMLMLGIMNKLVTLRPFEEGISDSRSVLLLDLDSDLPIFAPPGTVSLISVNKPVLGPPFACPTTNQYDQAARGDIITVHRIDWQQQGTSDIQQLSKLVALARASLPQGAQHTPLLIKANDWMERIDTNEAKSLAKILAPTSVVCFGSENASASGQLGESIATKYGTCSFTSFPTPNSRDPALHVQHEMALQSHFHFRGYRLLRPRWNYIPLALDHRSVVCLSYGFESALVSKILLPGLDVDADDVFDVLRGCIVAVIVQDSAGLTGTTGTTGKKAQTLRDSHQSNQQTYASGANSPPFLGFGIIVGLNEEETGVRMVTPISPRMFEYHHEHGHKVQLIAQRADSSGRFDCAWVQLEDETMSSQERLPEVAHKHGLDLI